MTTDNLDTLLDRILAHPDVRAKRVEWYESACPKCGYSLWVRGVKLRTSICRHCRHESRDDDPSPLPQLYTGPALNTIDGEGHLLKLADSIFTHGVSIGWDIACEDGDYYKRHYCIGYIDEPCFNSHGPDRRAAVIDALHKALYHNTPPRAGKEDE